MILLFIRMCLKKERLCSINTFFGDKALYLTEGCEKKRTMIKDLFYRAGSKAISNKEYEAGIHFFEELITINPDDSTYYLGLEMGY